MREPQGKAGPTANLGGDRDASAPVDLRARAALQRRYKVFRDVKDDGSKDQQPPPEIPHRPYINQAVAQAALNKTFGYLKQIDMGKVEILNAADFRAAYDKEYGAGNRSWEKLIIPKYGGKLEGVTISGVLYINEELVNIDTIPHEMLHHNAAHDFRAVVGDDFSEGVTERLTIQCMNAIGKAHSASYPQENACVQAAIDAGVTEDDLLNAYFVGGAQTRIADFVDENCVGSMNDVKQAMKAQDWAKAKHDLTHK